MHRQKKGQSCSATLARAKEKFWIELFTNLKTQKVTNVTSQVVRQIVCTAEDVDLAHFLSRRLRCSAPGEGSFIEMEYSIDAGVRVANETKIDPLPQQVLLAAAAG